jgi:hypothetical protein
MRKEHGWYEDDIFLYAAFVHGMEAGDEIHNKALFPFVQTHVTRKTIMPMQRCLEKNEYWSKVDAGTYALNERGHSEYVARFGSPPAKAQIDCAYRFFLPVGERLFIVISDSVDKRIKLYVEQGGSPSKLTGKEFVDRLRANGARIVVSRTDPLYIQDWIVTKREDWHWDRVSGSRLANFESFNATVNGHENH